MTVRQMLAQLNIGAATNDLRSLKAYLDSDACSIRDNATVEYTYNASPLIYRQDADGTVQKLNPDTTFTDIAGQNASVSSLLTSVSSPHVFGEMAETPALYEDQYDIKAGRWPEKYNELVLVLNANGSISDYALYAMGLRDQAELDKILTAVCQQPDGRSAHGLRHLQLRRVSRQDLPAGQQSRLLCL